MRIFNTTDYKMFKTILGNRTVQVSHVKNLINSIGRNNQLESYPIQVNEHNEVVDGQHRLAAAAYLKVPIYYFIAYGAGINEMLNHNVNNLSWKTSDFMQFFVKNNNSNYIILYSFCKKYGISVSTGMLLMENGAHIRNSMDTFKSGKFIAKNVARATEMIERLSEIRPYTELGVWKDREFISTMYHVYKKITHKDLMKQLKRTEHKLTPKSSVRNYLRAIEDIYNYRLHYKINLSS